MSIWLLRTVLLLLSSWLAALAIDVAPSWALQPNESRIMLGVIAALGIGILGATFAKAEQARNLATLAGWAVCLGAATLIGPEVVARLS